VASRAGTRPLGRSGVGAAAGSVLRIRGIRRTPAVRLGAAWVRATLRIGAENCWRATGFTSGNTWTGGTQYLPKAIIGPTTHAFDASVALQFFASHAR
jgi:poly(3-hydroxybutyrate) depolymerase